MIFALAGNQNCGKTTLFNALTGSNQHVGNFPGVTVDQKIGQIRGVKDCSVVDLPGMDELGVSFDTADKTLPAKDIVADYYARYEEHYGLSELKRRMGFPEGLI